MRFCSVVKHWLVVLCLIQTGTAGAQPDLTNPVYRLLRGEFQYHYLNDDYQRALNSLRELKMYQESLADDELALMEAAVYLGLGLTDDADDIFRANSQVTASGNFWFYLARAWWQDGRWEETEWAAERALKTRSDADNKPLAAAYVEEARFLLVSSMARQDRITDALTALQKMPDSALWTGFARYNLIIARMRLYSPGRDIEKLVEEAVFYAPQSYEGQALRDRVLLVAGIHALEIGKSREAEIYLSQVSQNTAFTAPALLQYGWALIEQWKYEEAMQPWRVLQQKYRAFHPAVMESILAVPHALELLNATTQSLKTYEMVEGRLQTMLKDLAQQNQADEIQSWLDRWLEQQDTEWGWQRTSVTDMPDEEFSATVQGLLDDPTFTSAAFRLHELTAMQIQIQRKLDDMAAWMTVVERRQQTLKSMNGEQRLRDLQRREQQLSDKVFHLGKALQAEDEKVFAFASDDDLDNVQNLLNVVPRVEFLQRINTPTRDLTMYKERWRRARGIQFWKIYENRPQREWDSQNAYWALQSEVSDLQTQLTNTRTAISWADSSWQGFPQRIERAVAALNQTASQLQALQHNERQFLQQQISGYLDELTVRVTDYQAQARLSIARLYDDALQINVAGQPEIIAPEQTPEANEVESAVEDEQIQQQTPEVAGE
ncbi:tetratricopeptide repeat protein [Thalassolituus marinus]|uniref:Tetratricopeptide repeat protein n=1 Tax=Thalassolituus marinus TaxID=671053 RepID=A0ABS7ZLH6_9GAMM|nr:hypothetical protein [Thalassolituus marinus]MCA6062571.1 hypothetical protein [Thalassolituus marinus]